MHPTRVLLLAFFLYLSGCSISAAVEKGPASHEEFVSKGFRTLTAIPLWISSRRNQASIHYRDVTECKVYCNGELAKDAECVGRTEVNCLTFSKGEDGSNQKVEVYSRTCDGRFVNDTSVTKKTFDTTQACRGLTSLTMRLEHQESENGVWVTDMFFEKTCAARFVMDVKEYVDPRGKRPDEMQVVTLCDGSAFTAIDNKATSEPLPRVEPVKPSHGEKAKVECDGEPSEWRQSCRGQFTAIEEDEIATRETSCKGKWIPYGVNWECDGVYMFTRTEKMKTGNSILERHCAGTALISSANHERVYQFCDGESKFNEIYTVPTASVT